VKALQQQLVLLNRDNQRDLTTESNIYDKWTITVEGIDVMTSKLQTATSTIVSHTFVGGRHLVTLEPDLGVEFEMGTSQATLSPPAKGGGDKVIAKVGYHVYPALQQILTVGDLVKDKRPDMPPLSDKDDFYCGYKFEIWAGDTLIAQQRVHEYFAQTHTFILKGALAMTGAAGKVESGSQFCLYPDQLLPQLRDSVTPKDVKKAGA